MAARSVHTLDPQYISSTRACFPLVTGSEILGRRYADPTPRPDFFQRCLRGGTAVRGT